MPELNKPARHERAFVVFLFLMLASGVVAIPVWALLRSVLAEDGVDAKAGWWDVSFGVFTVVLIVSIIGFVLSAHLASRSEASEGYDPDETDEWYDPDAVDEVRAAKWRLLMAVSGVPAVLSLWRPMLLMLFGSDTRPLSFPRDLLPEGGWGVVAVVSIVAFIASGIGLRRTTRGRRPVI